MGPKYSKNIRSRIINLWDDRSSYRSAIYDILESVSKDCLDNSRTPFAEAFSSFNLNKREDLDKMLNFKMPHPDTYQDAKSYYLDNLLNTLGKKYPHWDTSYQPKDEAIKTFISCEIDCLNTNNRIRQSRSIYSRDDRSAILSIARRKIALILGDVPDIDKLHFQFGPGATFSVKGRTTAYDKLGGALDVTPESKTNAVKLLQSTPGWLSLHGLKPEDTARIEQCLTVIPGDRLSFVPKTAKTDRPIAIGPSINVLLQKGVGTFIRNKLRRTGRDLNTLPETHRKLAQRASEDDSLATIDLSSASDTISFELVRELLPFGWFSLLNSLRSHRYTIEDKWYEYHKFSAMGNGFTFELESLIFYAVAYATSRFLGLPTREVSAFGDDIITSTGSAPLVIEMLEYLGFTTNKEKTFVNSKFRESCGGDFYKSIYVRGFYFKDYTSLRDIVRFRNYLYRTGYRFWLKRTWRLLRKLLSDFEVYLAGPNTESDDHIVFDDHNHWKSYNYVSITKAKRKGLPCSRRELGRVFLLYRAMNIRAFDLTTNHDTSSLGFDINRVIIKICSRSV